MATMADDDRSAVASVVRDHDKDSTSVPYRRNNNLVAESDIDAALKGIADCFAEHQQQQREHDNNSLLSTAITTIDPTNNENEEYQNKQRQMTNIAQKVQQRLLSSIQESFCKNLQRAVQPISDNAYHVYLYRNRNCGSDDAKVITTATEAASLDQVQDIDNHNEQYNTLLGMSEEYDEESLLDQEALQRARDLRGQVRRAAQRVGALRKSVLDRAIVLANRQIQLWRDEQQTAMEPEGRMEDMIQMNAEWNSLANSKRNEQLQEMEQSLRTLMQRLQQANEELPNRMEKLQEAIETIEKGIVESNNTNNNLFYQDDPTAMSSGDDRKGDEVEDDDDDAWGNDWDKMTAEMKLATFLRS